MTEIDLREAAWRMSASQGIALSCLRRGEYDDIVELTARRARGSLHLARVAVERVPELLEVTWDFVLYKRDEGLKYHGPWVPTDPVRTWLQRQIRRRANAAQREANPAVLKQLARDLNIDIRRLYAWIHGEYQHINYAVMEDALWAYGCMAPEDICPRDQMIISKMPKVPPKGRRKK